MVQWDDKDREELRELLDEDALLGRLFSKLEEEDFEIINRVSNVQGDTAELIALNATLLKGRLTGLHGCLALIIEYAQEKKDGN